MSRFFLLRPGTEVVALPYADAKLAVAPFAQRRLPIESNFALFAIFFAVWVLIDQSFFPQWMNIWPALLTAPLAGLVILRPNSVKLFLALLGASLWSFCWKCPFHVNNVFIGAFFAALILGATFVYVVRHHRLPAGLGELERGCFPAIRVGVVLIFLGAVLHKSNSAFMTPSMSCAVIHTTKLIALFAHGMNLVGLHRLTGLLPNPQDPAVGKVVIWMTLATEFGIPFILTLGWLRLPTRKLVTIGIVIAMGFHIVMSLNGYQNFSVMAVAYYVPFLPVDFYRSISAQIIKLRRSKLAPVFNSFMWMLIIGVGLFAFELLVFSCLKAARPLVKLRGETFVRNEGWAAFNFFFAPAVSLLFIYFSAMRFGRPNRMAGTRVPWWSYPLFGLVLLNVLSPYLGLKTENSFAMFSNLLTEGGSWNNEILPHRMQVFHFQDNLVTVQYINTPGPLADLMDGKMRIVEFEFRRNLAMLCKHVKTPIEVQWLVNGKTYHVMDAHEVPELANGNPYWQEKLMFFRLVPNSPYGVCLH